MKKLFTTLVVSSLLGSELFAGFSVVGKVEGIEARSDGSFWVSVKRTSDDLTVGMYKVSGSSEALKAIQAVVLSAKVTSAPVKLYLHDKQWLRAQLLP